MTVRSLKFLADGNAIIREADGTETLVPAHDAPTELARLMGARVSVPSASRMMAFPSGRNSRLWTVISASPQ